MYTEERSARSTRGHKVQEKDNIQSKTKLQYRKNDRENNPWNKGRRVRPGRGDIEKERERGTERYRDRWKERMKER